MNTGMSRRRLLGLAGGAALALGTFGCGGGNGGGAGFAQPEGKVPDQYKKRQRVVVWMPYAAAVGEHFTKLVAKFNESQQDIYLDSQFQGTYDELAQKLAAGLQARQIPDLAIFSEVVWRKFLFNEALAPLKGFFGDGLQPTDYVDSLIQEGTVKDEVWWVPFGRSTPLFYYNKTMFAQAGLPDRGPKTWDELRSWGPALAKVKVNGKAPKLHAFPQVDGDWHFQGVVWQFGGNYSKDLDVTIDQGGAVAAGEWQRQLIHVDKQAYMTKSPKIDFQNGLIATLHESTGTLGSLIKDAKFEIGTSFVPEQVQFGCPTGGGGLSIMGGAPKERQQAAFEFVKFAAKPENAAQWSIDTGYMPVTKAALETPQMQARFTERPAFKVAVDQLPKTQSQDPVRLMVPNANRAIYGGLQKIYADNRPAQEVFKGVAEELRKSTDTVRAQIEKYT